MAGSILYSRSYPINEKIKINIPLLGEVIDNEDAYNGIIAAVSASPTDFMVELDDVGIDFSEISSYELFLLLFSGLKEFDVSLVFGDLDLSKFKLMVNPQNGMPILRDAKNDITIDRSIHELMRRALYDINCIEFHDKKPGNLEAKKYMIERARIKKKRAIARNKHKHHTQLEEIIVALVNSEPFKYDFESVRNLTIYQFYVSMHQVVRKTNYNNLMIGAYTGSIDTKCINNNELNWLTK